MTFTQTEQVSGAPHSKNRRPRLLFLARGFPPARASACTRTWNIAKQLSRLGWEVTVVTLHPSVWRRVDNPQEVERKLNEEGVKRILTDHHWRCLAHDHLNTVNNGVGWLCGGLSRAVARRLGIDDGIGWIGPAERACSTLSRGDVDLILATAHPVSSFRLAQRLSKRLACPYIMDYRDPWTQNPHRKREIQKRRIREEGQLLAGSAGVTIVSRSWADALERQYGLNGKLHVISNGYDPDELAQIQPVEFGHFAIVYTGIFYPPKRIVTPIMQALRFLREISPASSDYFFHYCGPNQAHVRDEAARYAVTDRVVLHGEVTQSEALSAVRGAGVAVVITSVSEHPSLDEQGIVTGKIFEPIGMNVPVLLVAPPRSDAETVVRATGLGEVFRASDVIGIARFLRNLMAGCELRQRSCGQYSWTAIVKSLDAVLRGLLDNDSARHCQAPVRDHGA